MCFDLGSAIQILEQMACVPDQDNHVWTFDSPKGTILSLNTFIQCGDRRIFWREFVGIYHRSFLWVSNSILYFGRQSTYLFLKWYHLFQHIYSRSARYKLLKCCQLTGLTVYPGIRPVIVSMIGALDDMHTSTIDVGLRISVYCTNSRWQARLSVRNVDCDRKSSNVRVGIKVPLFARTSMIVIDNRIC